MVLMLELDNEVRHGYVKPALTALMLALSLASAGVRAQEPAPAAPAAREPAAEPDAPSRAVKPPPKRKPIKRRSVQQVIEPTPPIVTDGYRPTLTGAPARRRCRRRLAGAGRACNSCDAGGCTDTSGARYNGGVGNTLIGPQGQLCTKGVVNAQCF